jgi:hypothetical protein
MSKTITEFKVKRAKITITDDPKKKNVVIEIWQDLGSPQLGDREAEIKIPRHGLDILITALQEAQK